MRTRTIPTLNKTNIFTKHQQVTLTVVNIYSSIAFPFVEIKYPNFRLLIDTGSSRSKIKRSIVEALYSDRIYRAEPTIKTALQISPISSSYTCI